MTTEQLYDTTFYEQQMDGSSRSARAVVPFVLERLRPTSVVDFGCGVGAWLAEFRARGITDVVGIDGPYVSESQLKIPTTSFLATDLTQPVNLSRRFDLAMSLEVAEHLPSERARSFVEDLTAASDIVMFSAAIPGQYGVNHVNEQWPEYWVEIFDKAGFEPRDVFRQRFWDDDAVEWWYSQNMMLFVRSGSTDVLQSEQDKLPLRVIHPRSRSLEPIQPSVREAARDLAGSIRRMVHDRRRALVRSNGADR